MIKIGDRIDDRYRIVSRIATGGMADVYEALVLQKQDKFREQLQQDLRDEALRTGLLKLKQ